MPARTAPAEPRPLWTLDQVAEYLDIHPGSVRRLIARGDLKAYRYGRRMIRIDPRDVEKMGRPIGAQPVTVE